MQARIRSRGLATFCRRHLINALRAFASVTTSSSKHPYDAIVVGGGHNGLTCAAYLAKAGLRPLVLERRHKVGGAAVTEELVEGFKFSRASYLLSLLRPVIFRELNLKQLGLKVHVRDPSSFTPLLDGRYLLLGSNEAQNVAEIAKFSAKDSAHYAQYEQWLSKMVDGIDPLLDAAPPDLALLLSGHSQSTAQPAKHLWKDRLGMWSSSMLPLLKAFRRLGVEGGLQFYQMLTAPATRTLKQHFESEPLLATLATDGVIGAFMGPETPGNGYVLLHHVMGELEGRKGAWGFVEGGMGAVSDTLAKVATQHGAEIQTNAEVEEILVETRGEHAEVKGVRLKSGEVIKARYVLSNATPKVTFLDLLPAGCLPASYQREIESISYTSATTKINVALKQLPNFTCCPNVGGPQTAMPHHQTTIHLGCATLGQLQDAYQQAVTTGRPSEVPMVEMCIPSVLDPTVAPWGCHVANLFVQYTPYSYFQAAGDVSESEAEKRKKDFTAKVFSLVDQYAPNFSSSVIFSDVLTPPDLERVFGLTGGNIFHGAMSLDQLYFARPSILSPRHSTPVKGLLLCGSGAHPGGAVMGSAGRNAALRLLAEFDWDK